MSAESVTPVWRGSATVELAADGAYRVMVFRVDRHGLTFAFALLSGHAVAGEHRFFWCVDRLGVPPGRYRFIVTSGPDVVAEQDFLLEE